MNQTTYVWVCQQADQAKAKWGNQAKWARQVKQENGPIKSNGPRER